MNLSLTISQVFGMNDITGNCFLNFPSTTQLTDQTTKEKGANHNEQKQNSVRMIFQAKIHHTSAQDHENFLMKTLHLAV